MVQSMGLLVSVEVVSRHLATTLPSWTLLRQHHVIQLR